MGFNTIEAIIYVFEFLLPGYVVNYIVNLVGRNEDKDSNSMLLRYLSLSSFEYGLWGWIIIMVVQSLDLSQWSSFLKVFFLLLFTSVISGLIIAWFIRKDFSGIIANATGIPLKRHIETAWDYIFSKEKGKYIMVHLKDDRKICGGFFRGSYASSDSKYRDIYIKEIFDIENGNWKENKLVESIWINPDSISYIEFMKGSNENANT